MSNLEQLIEHVKQNSVLYDRGHSLYWKEWYKERIWRRIARVLRICEAHTIKYIWNLQVKNFRKLMRTENESNECETFKAAMKFLIPHLDVSDKQETPNELIHISSDDGMDDLTREGGSGDEERRGNGDEIDEREDDNTGDGTRSYKKADENLDESRDENDDGKGCEKGWNENCSGDEKDCGNDGCEDEIETGRDEKNNRDEKDYEDGLDVEIKTRTGDATNSQTENRKRNKQEGSIVNEDHTEFTRDKENGNEYVEEKGIESDLDEQTAQIEYNVEIEIKYREDDERTEAAKKHRKDKNKTKTKDDEFGEFKEDDRSINSEREDSENNNKFEDVTEDNKEEYDESKEDGNEKSLEKDEYEYDVCDIDIKLEIKEELSSDNGTNSWSSGRDATSDESRKINENDTNSTNTRETCKSTSDENGTDEDVESSARRNFCEKRKKNWRGKSIKRIKYDEVRKFNETGEDQRRNRGKKIKYKRRECNETRSDENSKSSGSDKSSGSISRRSSYDRKYSDNNRTRDDKKSSGSNKSSGTRKSSDNTRSTDARKSKSSNVESPRNFSFGRRFSTNQLCILFASSCLPNDDTSAQQNVNNPTNFDNVWFNTPQHVPQSIYKPEFRSDRTLKPSPEMSGNTPNVSHVYPPNFITDGDSSPSSRTSEPIRKNRDEIDDKFRDAQTQTMKRRKHDGLYQFFQSMYLETSEMSYEAQLRIKRKVFDSVMQEEQLKSAFTRRLDNISYSPYKDSDREDNYFRFTD